MRIAIYGGSFNPPHVAHQLALRLRAGDGAARRRGVDGADLQASVRQAAGALRRSRHDVRAGGVAVRGGARLAHRGGAGRRELHAAHHARAQGAPSRSPLLAGHRRRSGGRARALARLARAARRWCRSSSSGGRAARRRAGSTCRRCRRRWCGSGWRRASRSMRWSRPTSSTTSARADSIDERDVQVDERDVQDAAAADAAALARAPAHRR